jgi:hypothetical protein
MGIDFVNKDKKNEKRRDQIDPKNFIEWTDAEEILHKKTVKNHIGGSQELKKDNTNQKGDMNLIKKQEEILSEISVKKKSNFKDFIDNFKNRKKNKAIAKFNAYSQSDKSFEKNSFIKEGENNDKPTVKKEMPVSQVDLKKSNIKIEKKKDKNSSKNFIKNFFSKREKVDLKNNQAENIVKKEEKPKIEEKNEVVANQWSQSKVIKTNLIGSSISQALDFQKNLINLLIVVFISILFVFGFYWLADYYYRVELHKYANLIEENEILKNNLNRQKEVAKDVEKFKNKLSLAKYLLENHIYWTNFLKFIEDNTLENVSFKGFSGDISGKYSLSAICDDIYGIEQQVKQFSANNYVNSVSVESAKISKNSESIKPSVDFVLKLDVNNDIFKLFK